MNLTTYLQQIKQRLEAVTPVPYKQSPLVFLEYNEKNELTENIKIMNEHLQLGFSAKDDLAKLIKIVEVLSEVIHGCSDGNCILRDRGGMRTNGGCHCKGNIIRAAIEAEQIVGEG